MSRRLGAVALLVTVAVTGALSAGVSSTAQAGDGPGRCCFKTAP